MKIECAHDELRDLSVLIPNPKNPNKHPPEQIKLLAKIMKHQGWRSPIVVSNRSGFIVKGHGRLEAAKLNGWSKAPIDFQDYNSDEDEMADLIADNEIARLAESNKQDILALALDLGPDFDFDLLGIPDFKLPEDFKTIDEINTSDENAEWIGMPEFKEGSKYIAIIFHFKTELEREEYAKSKNLKIDMKKSNQWIVYR